MTGRESRQGTLKTDRTSSSSFVHCNHVPRFIVAIFLRVTEIKRRERLTCISTLLEGKLSVLSFPLLDVLHVGWWKNGRKQEEETRDPPGHCDSLKRPDRQSEEKVSLENPLTASPVPSQSNTNDHK